MAQYSPLSGEGLFDVAVKLYDNDTALGISDLLSLNPAIDINADLFGTALIYTPGISRIKPVLDPITTTPISVYKTHLKQSIFDLAVQLYGDVSKIGEILGKISDINGEITLGTVFNVPLQTDPQALFFLDKIVATEIESFEIIEPDHLLLESGDSMLTESGDLILIE